VNVSEISGTPKDLLFRSVCLSIYLSRFRVADVINVALCAFVSIWAYMGGAGDAGSTASWRLSYALIKRQLRCGFRNGCLKQQE